MGKLSQQDLQAIREREQSMREKFFLPEQNDIRALLDHIAELEKDLARAATPSPSVGEQARKAAEEWFTAARQVAEDAGPLRESALSACDNAGERLAAIITKHVSSPVDVEAIKEVKRFRDEWQRRYDEIVGKSQRSIEAHRIAKVDAANEIISALESITTVPSPDTEKQS